MMHSSKMKKYSRKKRNEDEDSYGLRQALPCTPIPDDFDPNIIPTSGDEYLQHVMFESRQLPRVVYVERVGANANGAPCDPNMVPMKPGIIPSRFAPSEDWERLQVERFEKLRQKMHRLRISGAVPMDRSHLPDVNESDLVWEEFLLSTKPLISVVLPQYQEHQERILSLLLKTNPGDKLWESFGCWIYAISACLEHPLSSEAYGELRDIARKCSQLRELKSDPNDEDIVTFNLIITLVVKYFRQYDLCE